MSSRASVSFFFYSASIPWRRGWAFSSGWLCLSSASLVAYASHRRSVLQLHENLLREVLVHCGRKNFTDDKVRLDGNLGSQRLCALLDDLPPPKKVPVFYNPRLPTENSLDRTMDVVMLAVGVNGLLIVFMLGFFFLTVALEEGCRVRKVLFRLGAAVYCFFSGGLLVAVAGVSIRNGNKIAAVSLVWGFVVVLVGFLCAWASTKDPISERMRIA